MPGSEHEAMSIVGALVVLTIVGWAIIIGVLWLVL
jgi:hypothetical protein